MEPMALADRLQSILGNLGIDVTRATRREDAESDLPTELKLRRGTSSQTYTVLSTLDAADGRARLGQLSGGATESTGRRLLFVADRINARTMTAYRTRKIDYVDLAGNALLRFGDVYVDIQGRSLGRPPAPLATRHSPVNLFSARRAQVIFALLVWPELLTLPIRYTSEAAGVSIGLTFQTIKLLRESGYVMGDANPHLVRKNELIERWTNAFITGLRNKLLLGRYRADSIESNGESGARWFVSGESAIPSLLRPTTLTIYVDQLTPQLLAENRWQRHGEPNVEVRKKFWTQPRQILEGRRGLISEGSAPEVPALLIYADLIASGDGRQREAAQTFRGEHSELVEG